jgi:hypothetical protein
MRLCFKSPCRLICIQKERGKNKHKRALCTGKICVICLVLSRALYFHMERVIFGEDSNDEFIVNVVEKDKPEEIKTLLELGFDPSCETSNLIFMRKHK